jgi:hypothetical protein
MNHEDFCGASVGGRKVLIILYKYVIGKFGFALGKQTEVG